mgnify:CR=1 FL=1
MTGTAIALQDRETRNKILITVVRRSIAEQAREMRRTAALTQKELSVALGLHKATISRIENPSGPFPAIRTLTKIANYFDAGLIIKFVAWSRFLVEYNILTGALRVVQ